MAQVPQARRGKGRMANPSVPTVLPKSPEGDRLPGGASPVVVRSFEPDLAARWDRFVCGHPGGTLFHLTGWKRVLERNFFYEPRYLYAERNETISGVAPVFFISNWVMGRCLLSLPFAAYGGICASDPESEQALLRHLRELAASERVDFLELRSRNGELSPGFSSNPRYATFSAPLDPDHEANLKRLPRDTRYMIRKAEKAGLRARNGMDQLGEFYRLLALSYQRLGTPVFPRTLFESLAQEFPDRTDLLVVYSGDKPVSGVFSFFFRDTVLPYYAGAAPEAPSLAANNFMYAELMKQAAASGYRRFDFGRSKKGTGAYAFKTQWNMTVESLNYQVHLVGRKTVPNFSPLNPKFQLATRVWQRLPLWLTTRMGPRVVRWFP